LHKQSETSLSSRQIHPQQVSEDGLFDLGPLFCERVGCWFTVRASAIVQRLTGSGFLIVSATHIRQAIGTKHTL
jgi:hypothetical protein